MPGRRQTPDSPSTRQGRIDWTGQEETERRHLTGRPPATQAVQVRVRQDGSGAMSRQLFEHEVLARRWRDLGLTWPSFYFGQILYVGLDDDRTRQQIFEEITSTGGIVLGHPELSEVCRGVLGQVGALRKVQVCGRTSMVGRPLVTSVSTSWSRPSAGPPASQTSTVLTAFIIAASLDDGGGRSGLVSTVRLGRARAKLRATDGGRAGA